MVLKQLELKNHSNNIKTTDKALKNMRPVRKTHGTLAPTMAAKIQIKK